LKKIDNAKNTVTEIRTLFKELKTEKFDLVTDLQGLLRSGIITSATRAPIRIGFQERERGAGFFTRIRLRAERISTLLTAI